MYNNRMGKVKMHFDYFTPSLVSQLIQPEVRPEVDNRQNRTIPIIWQHYMAEILTFSSHVQP